ncbi:hypothetical protein RDI58_031496 [Solanum bulbocastanum]|uniref:Protein TIC 214 n=1 Tax=Solanum bulbocastanum TaxID=147425 RepID=A0AAN8SN13_SOLBU
MEEGTEKKVSATTGFITGQLMMFISIYYAPLHLALGRPHTITVLALPYLLFHFFWNNHKHFFDYGSTTRNSMRNLSIQCVFLNNLIFQLFNHFILPKTGYNNINTSNSPIYDYQDSYLNNNNTGNLENFKLQLLDKKNENQDLFWFQKPLVSLLFDYNRWNRPFRYIKNNRFEQAVRTEMSQYFFDTCKSDGKQRISFTYPPSLSTFWKMIKRKIPLLSLQKTLPNKLDTQWVSTNKEKSNNLNKEFLNRLEILDKESLSMDILETRTRLCNDDTKKEYVPKMYDPLLNGPYRGTIKKGKIGKRELD